jgi:hypothetical protein
MNPTNPFLGIKIKKRLPTPHVYLSTTTKPDALIQPSSPSPIKTTGRNIAISLQCGESNLGMVIFDLNELKVLVMRLVSYPARVNSSIPMELASFLSDLFQQDIFTLYPSSIVGFVLINRPTPFVRSSHSKGLKAIALLAKLNAMQGNAYSCIKLSNAESSLHGFFMGKRIPTDTAGADTATFARKILGRKDLNTPAAKAKVIHDLLVTAINGDSVIKFEPRAVREYRSCLRNDIIACTFAQLAAYYCDQVKLFKFR